MLMTPEHLKTLEKPSLMNRRLTMRNLFHLYENPYNITPKEFTRILEVYNEALVMDMCRTGTIYRLSSTAGVIAVVKTNFTRAGSKDWRIYYETKGEVYKKQRNAHSSGYATRIIWYTFYNVPRSPGFVVNSTKFTPARTFKRYLAKCILELNTINLYSNED